MKTIKLFFVPEKDTKNTIRFSEVVNNDLDICKVGAIYLNKSALKEMGWQRGQQLEVTITAK